MIEGGGRKSATITDLAWAAGLFEGEGCFNVYTRKSGKQQVQMRLGMTDEDVVVRFKSIVGCGTVRGPIFRRPDEKPMWDWCIYEAVQVRRLIDVFMPWLGNRRRAKALEVLEKAAFIRVAAGIRTHCPQGHPYSGDNLVVERVGPAKASHLGRRCRVCRNIAGRDRKRRINGTTPDRFRVKESA